MPKPVPNNICFPPCPLGGLEKRPQGSFVSRVSEGKGAEAIVLKEKGANNTEMPEQKGQGSCLSEQVSESCDSHLEPVVSLPPLHGDLHIFACICITKSVESALMVPA